MNLGEAIKKQRKAMGLTQSDLATRCGITPSYLSMIEKNKKEPNLATLKRMSEHLQVPLPVLFFRALDESDVPDSKKETYGVINKSLNNLIDSLFDSNNHKK